MCHDFVKHIELAVDIWNFTDGNGSIYLSKHNKNSEEFDITSYQ